MVRVTRHLPERADTTAACPTLAVRVGGSSTPSVDDELQIVLGADSGRRRRAQAEANDEIEGMAMLRIVEEELRTLVRGLGQALGLAQSAALIDDVLRGRRASTVDIWCLTPHIYQYFSARVEMITHFVSQFDEHCGTTVRFGREY